MYILTETCDIFGMANLNPKKTKLKLIIWADHSGIQRKVSHRNTPKVKIGNNDFRVSALISDKPVILDQSRKLKVSEQHNVEDAMDYVAQNNDLFLKHYLDTDFNFDDEDLFNALRERGDY